MVNIKELPRLTVMWGWSKKYMAICWNIWRIKRYDGILTSVNLPLSMPRDNAACADNQQERLIKIGWILGFVDGEGCFSVGFIRQQDRVVGENIRRGYKIGYQAFHEFAVTQGEKSVHVLHSLKEYFGVGKVYVNRRHDNHKESLYRYVVRRREDLLNVIIPFFQNHSLQTAKKIDFEKFARCIEMAHDGKHLTREGLIEMVQIVETMNRQKSRTSLIGILRDHTPCP